MIENGVQTKKVYTSFYFRMIRYIYDSCTFYIVESRRRIMEEVHLSHSFVSLYDRYFNDVYRYVYVKTGNKWDAEDIVSETFRKAFEKIHSLKNDSNPKSWLMSIARNNVIDFYRKKKGVLVGDDLELYLSPIPFLDPLDESDELGCLKKSLGHLAKEDLEIVNLRYFAGLKFKEMASILNKEDSAIRVKSSRITKRISILIKKCLGE
jgi:RNA polymerase sigma factor (sigma-70 family)